nr:cellulose 1,4-beta-cellobiosidase (EC 3.2.1.91) - Ruminococcus flavefaciens [Ruminococcus flavefaciens]prf//1707267A cellodextrinase [Ruminococcus flavefaciens]
MRENPFSKGFPSIDSCKNFCKSTAVMCFPCFYHRYFSISHGCCRTCCRKCRSPFPCNSTLTGNAVLAEHLVDDLEPLQRILGGHDIDHTVFTAVKSSAVLLGRAYGCGEKLLEIRLGSLAVLEFHPLPGDDIGSPCCTLMSEFQRFVAVEIVHYPVIVRRIEELHCVRCIIVVASEKNNHLGSYFSNPSDTDIRNLVPLADERLIGHLIEKLKNDIVGVVAVIFLLSLPTGCRSAPDTLYCRKRRFQARRNQMRNRLSCGVDDQFQPIFAAKFNDLVYSVIAVLDNASVVILNDIIVDGKSYVVESPVCYLLYVVFLYKVIQSFTAVVTLRHPSAQIDSLDNSSAFKYNIHL